MSYDMCSALQSINLGDTNRSITIQLGLKGSLGHKDARIAWQRCYDVLPSFSYRAMAMLWTVSCHRPTLSSQLRRVAFLLTPSRLSISKNSSILSRMQSYPNSPIF